jgi:hypothetical protein
VPLPLRLFGCLVLSAAVAVSASSAASGGASSASCPRARVNDAYAAHVRQALLSGSDRWGEALLSRPGGPTFAGAARFLHPLLFARSRRGPVTASGVYYVPFGEPLGTRGAFGSALHVADGSEILASRGPRSLTVLVGDHGRERYGACLSKLAPARLAHGWLPILDTAYTDTGGVRYRQESFAARVYGARSLISFVRLHVDATRARAGALVRFMLSDRGLSSSGDRLTRDDAAALLFSPDAQGSGSSIGYRVAPGEQATLYVAWLLHPETVSSWLHVDEQSYLEARDQVARFWEDRLGRGATFDVPDQRVMDAERSLLIQELTLTWRYSVGNTYQELSFPEAVDVARVLGSYGYLDVMRAMLATSAARLEDGPSNWKAGELLLATAEYFRLSGDSELVRSATPLLMRLVVDLGRQLGRHRNHGLLDRERYSADVAATVFGLHSQAVAWQGLQAMAGVWAETGRLQIAATARVLAGRLGSALRRAVHRSERRLGDGSLFVPAALLAKRTPFARVTASRTGSYWNLVLPYALASGLFPPHSREAQGVLEFMLRHGSRLLGLVRAGGYSLYGHPVYPISGTDESYGTNVARFLADNDVPGQLVLSLYGSLAAAMTPNTFVSGEAASVAPLHHEYYRSMYLPPNTAGNASFLETLRLSLVHETRDRGGAPDGLELAYATPRGWLAPGHRISVDDAPTSFGHLSYTLTASAHLITGSVELPSSRRRHTVRLRLRLPPSESITAVRVDDRRAQVDRHSGTITLPATSGPVGIIATVRAAAGRG